MRAPMHRYSRAECKRLACVQVPDSKGRGVALPYSVSTQGSLSAGGKRPPSHWRACWQQQEGVMGTGMQL